MSRQTVTANRKPSQVITLTCVPGVKCQPAGFCSLGVSAILVLMKDLAVWQQ